MDKAGLDAVEQLLFQQYATPATADVPLLFILGSPRTGSTLIYQIIVNAYATCYFSNVIEQHFPTHPILGMVLHQALRPSTPTSYESHYGKTVQPWEPSEASRVFTHWCGGAHPAQVYSRTVLPEKRAHCEQTLRAIYGYTQRCLIIKNAWNCFRIRALKELFPRACFLWIRRDIGLCAISDLESRYKRGDPNKVWNSATTANYLELQQRPYWEQVVEQQYEYNHAIGVDLAAVAGDHYLEMWYEDLCANTSAEVARVTAFAERCGLPLPAVPVDLQHFQERSKASQLQDDHAKIKAYIATHGERLRGYSYTSSAREQTS